MFLIGSLVPSTLVDVPFAWLGFYNDENTMNEH
jgi:hypothetical protein